MTEPTKKRLRHDFSLEEKLWLLDYRQQHPKVSATVLAKELAKHLNASRSKDQVEIAPPGKSTVNDWVRSEQKLRQNSSVHSNSTQRIRAAANPQLEQALAMWFHQQEARDLIITNDMVVGQAKALAARFNVGNSFAFSDGWIAGFKSRFGLKRVTLHGEANSADQENVQKARENMKHIIAAYSISDVYNQDETGVFWRALPHRSLASGKRAGRKKDKQRVTASITCNADGTDKRQLFVIGKSKRPRSFPKSFQPARDWNIRYRSNTKAWMLSSEFAEWVLEWNASLQR